MKDRTEKVKLLDSIFNQGNKENLKSLSRASFPCVLIFEPQGGGLLFSEKLNEALPARYQNKVMDDKELDTMLLTGGKGTAFLLPDNGRD
ncbi:MAG: hypothetical protein V4585_17590 [Bacteroidota bacterium]